MVGRRAYPCWVVQGPKLFVCKSEGKRADGYSGRNLGSYDDYKRVSLSEEGNKQRDRGRGPVT
jgi:hypothetical protein